MHNVKVPFDHRYDSVQLLIDLEADVNIQDGFKMQPLMYACNSGSFQCAGLLLQYGANAVFPWSSTSFIFVFTPNKSLIQTLAAPSSE
jgi:ankyrin repeat protein